ncbi:arabinose ABC transporter substrate-binding protein [soil metagenome]
MTTHILKRKGLGASAIVLSAALALSACSSGTAPAPTGGGVKVTKLAYIVKFGTAPYFIAENSGVQSKSAELGITTTTTDVADKSDAAIAAVDTSIGLGAQGLIVVAPNQDLGPVILTKAAKAGIPVIAVDDPLKDTDGKFTPFVGFDAEAIGTQVGEELGKLVNEAKIDAADIKIASVEDQKTPVCMTRNNAAQAALAKAVPGISDANVIHIPYNNDLNSAITAVAPIVTSNPDVKYWLSYSCNDDGVLGAWRAFAAQGFPADRFFGVGLGGAYACQAFAEKSSGFRATYYIDSAVHGQKAVQELYDFLKNGTAIPEKTIIPGTLIDVKNFADIAKC